jgi:hypothetical protein
MLIVVFGCIYRYFWEHKHMLWHLCFYRNGRSIYQLSNCQLSFVTGSPHSGGGTLNPCDNRGTIQLLGVLCKRLRVKWLPINCIFLLITYLTDFFIYLFISSLYMFRASRCSSSEDRIVLIHHLVWLVSVSDCFVCRSGGNSFLTGIPSSHLLRLSIPDNVLIQFDLLMMSAVMLETYREMKWINTWKSASSWLLARICNEMHSQQNVKNNCIFLADD